MSKYEIKVWENEEMRDLGEPYYATPICSQTDLEAIKKEVERYNIEDSGCIEISVKGNNSFVLHYENGKWEEC